MKHSINHFTVFISLLSPLLSITMPAEAEKNTVIALTKSKLCGKEITFYTENIANLINLGWTPQSTEKDALNLIFSAIYPENEAQLNAKGLIYHYGLFGQKQSTNQAIYYYKTAVEELYSSLACCNLAVLSMTTGNEPLDSTQMYFEKAVELANGFYPPASYCLFNLRFTKRGAVDHRRQKEIELRHLKNKLLDNLDDVTKANDASLTYRYLTQLINSSTPSEENAVKIAFLLLSPSINKIPAIFYLRSQFFLSGFIFSTNTEKAMRDIEKTYQLAATQTHQDYAHEKYMTAIILLRAKDMRKKTQEQALIKAPALKGNIQAKNVMGELYLKKPIPLFPFWSYLQAQKAFNKAADQGCPEALYNLAKMYFNPPGFPFKKKPVKACMYCAAANNRSSVVDPLFFAEVRQEAFQDTFFLAEKLQYAFDQYDETGFSEIEALHQNRPLSFCYLDNKLLLNGKWQADGGTSFSVPNHETVILRTPIESLHQAACQDDTVAKYHLAKRFFFEAKRAMRTTQEEAAVRWFEQAAVRWLEQAAKAKDTLSQYCLGCLLLKKNKSNTERLRGITFICESADQDFAPAQYAKALLIETHELIVQQKTQTVQDLIESAAKKHYAPALSWQGERAIKQNPKKAYRYLERSAKQDYPLAFYHLGFLYHYGKGVEQNIDKAKQYYRQARDKGFNPAKKALMALDVMSE